MDGARQTTPFRELVAVAVQMAELAARGEVLGEDLVAARALGQEAFRIGGVDGMHTAFKVLAVAWVFGYIVVPDFRPRFHPSQFARAWNGIGPWRGN